MNMNNLVEKVNISKTFCCVSSAVQCMITPNCLSFLRKKSAHPSGLPSQTDTDAEPWGFVLAAWSDVFVEQITDSIRHDVHVT